MLRSRSEATPARDAHRPAELHRIALALVRRITAACDASIERILRQRQRRQMHASSTTRPSRKD